MKVVSVNRGEARVVNWRGKKVRTGIYKYPVDGNIQLGAEDVVGDAVVDRKHHGGEEMAVYAYSADQYPFWKARFPNSDWSLGMFGENLTIEGMDESKMHIGSQYAIGDAIIEVCQPREPCFKLGIRFGTQAVLKEFIHQPYPGVYFRVKKPGVVKVGDELVEVLTASDAPSIADVYALMYRKETASAYMVSIALSCEALPIKVKEKIRKVLNG